MAPGPLLDIVGRLACSRGVGASGLNVVARADPRVGIGVNGYPSS